MIMLLCLNTYGTQHPDELNVKINKESLNKIHKSVHSRFVAEEGNPEGETFQYYTTEDKIYGDCDDFASAIYYVLWKEKLNPTVYVYDRDGDADYPDYRHVIVCAKGYCFDSNMASIFSKRKFKRQLRYEFSLVASGKFNNNAMSRLLEKEATLATRSGD
jgi:hypothetical protein